MNQEYFLTLKDGSVYNLELSQAVIANVIFSLRTIQEAFLTFNDVDNKPHAYRIADIVLFKPV